MKFGLAISLLCFIAQLHLASTESEVLMCNRAQIKCYVCIAPAQPGCADPFRSKDIQLETCKGCCIKATRDGVTTRSCANEMTQETPESYLQKVAGLAKEGIYMCSTDACNPAATLWKPSIFCYTFLVALIFWFFVQ